MMEGNERRLRKHGNDCEFRECSVIWATTVREEESVNAKEAQYVCSGR